MFSIFKKKERSLFSGDDALFKDLARKSQIFGEYGCGDSTLWVAENTDASIISVDTNAEWVNLICSRLSPSRLNVHISAVDLGPVMDWGRPAGYSRSDFFSNYTDLIWSTQEQPDLVLIDGRFRVCCFFTSLLRAAPRSIILFDDYIDRANYHVVEKYISPVELYGRQGVFEVPELTADREIEVVQDIERFRYVMD